MGYQTPADWLPYLTKGLDAQAAENAKFRSYANGTQPGPEMSAKTRASWQTFQKRARVIFPRLIAESLASRITPTSVRVAADEDGQAKARAIWRRSRLDVQLADAILDALIVGRAFLCVAVNAFGQAVITFESADQTYAVVDPLDPTSLRAAIKVWRDDVTATDHARVWTETSRQDFSRPSTRSNSKALRTTNSGGWEPQADEVAADGVPLTMLLNRDGIAEFGYCLDLVDRISLDILQRLTISAYQAARLRAVKGLSEEQLEDEDVQRAVFDLSPGALIDLPDGAELWEGQTTDFRPLLEATRDDIKELAAATSTPLSALIPDGANQSAEGALAAREAQILKALDRQRRFGPVIEGALLKALRMETSGAFDHDVEASWMNPALSTLNERTNAAIQVSGLLPFFTIVTELLGFTPEQADAMQLQRDTELYTASIAAELNTPAAAATPAA